MITRKTFLIVAASLVLAALLIYANVLNGEFVFDDFEYVVENPLIRDLSQVSMSDPRQIGYLSFAVNYALGGEEPWGYHLVNIAIHAVNAVLVFLLVGAVLTALSGSDALEGRSFRIALLAAALFVVHPVQTQAVSYITQRFTSLSALFYLLAVLLYLRSRRLLEREQVPGRGYLLYALSLVSTLLAMRTKEISFTIPFIVAAAEAALMRGSRYGSRRFTFLIPFGALLLVIPLSLLGPEFGLLAPGEGIVETTRTDKLYDMQERSAYEYALTQTRMIVLYLKLLVVPAGQSVVRDIRASRTAGDPAVIGSLLFLAGLAALGWLLWRRGSRADAADGAGQRLAAAGIFWFFVTISVESSFIPIKDLFFEHRIYLPSAGFAAAAAVALTVLVDRVLRSWSERRRMWISLVVCLPLAAVTVVRNDVWTTELKLWDDVVRKVPNKAIGYNNRGTAYAKERQYELALRDLDRTIGFFPRSLDAVMPDWEDADLIPPNISKTYLTRGRIHLALGNTQLAERDFERAKKIFFPAGDLEEYFRTGDLYYQRGAYRHAIEEFSKVLDRDPENIDALNNRGNSYSQLEKYDAAVRDFDLVIGLDPGFALAYHNRGIAFAWMEQRERAVADFTRACSLGFAPACESIEIARQGGK